LGLLAVPWILFDIRPQASIEYAWFSEICRERCYI
jgi:hypothetical protein